MRMMMCLLAATSLAACEPDGAGQSDPTVPVTAAAIEYDGASAGQAGAQVAHGERLSAILGCKGCHGMELTGRNVTKNDPSMGEWWAPNVTLHMADYSDQELDRLIRHGEPKDKRTFYFMPAESLQYLSDADLSALIAYLRTLKPSGEQLPPVKKGPLFLQLEQAGEFAPAPEMIRRFRDSTPIDLGEQHRLGRYIAMTVCSECHNSELQGYTGFSPTLDTAGAYSVPELERLLTTGEGKVKKNLGLMIVSAGRFAQFTPRERSAIVDYLKARADRPQ